MKYSLSIEPPETNLPATMGDAGLGVFYLVNTSSGEKKACVRINTRILAFFNSIGRAEWSDTPTEYKPIQKLGRIKPFQH